MGQFAPKNLKKSRLSGQRGVSIGCSVSIRGLGFEVGILGCGNLSKQVGFPVQCEAIAIAVLLMVEVFATESGVAGRSMKRREVKARPLIRDIYKMFCNALVWSLLKFRHAENTNLHHKRFCNTLRLHHHGEGEKALLASAKKCGALGVAFLQ